MIEERVYNKNVQSCDECPMCEGLPFESLKCLLADKVPWDRDPNVMLLRVIDTYPEIPKWCKLPKKQNVQIKTETDK